MSCGLSRCAPLESGPSNCLDGHKGCDDAAMFHEVGSGGKWLRGMKAAQAQFMCNDDGMCSLGKLGRLVFFLLPCFHVTVDLHVTVDRLVNALGT